MPTLDAGVFGSLIKWAHRQDENFTTESFVYLFSFLQENDPEIAAGFLNLLLTPIFNFNKDNVRFVNVRTQASNENGRPDIEISFSDSLILIEIKVNSDFGNDQIKRYRSELKKHPDLKTCLVTITKYPLSNMNAENMPDKSVRWHQIYEFCNSILTKNEVSVYLIREFQKFLLRSNLTMEKVSYELVEGLRSFQKLCTMLSEALASLKMPIYTARAAWDWYGFYIEKKKLFVGIYYNIPNAIQVTSECKIKVADGAKLTMGVVERGKWRNILDLDSEDVHFFSRSALSQLQCLEKFIKESAEFAREKVI